MAEGLATGPATDVADLLAQAAAEDPDRLAIVESGGRRVTWGELDYSAQRLVPPERWLEFAESHDWHDHDRASRVFSLACDIALHSTRLGAAS